MSSCRFVVSALLYAYFCIFPTFLSSASMHETVSADPKWRRISMNIREECGNVIDSIRVEGNEHTKSFVITREMATRVGDRLDEEKLRRDYSFLKWMGFFSEVDFVVEDTRPGHCNLIVHVVERPNLFIKYPYPVVNYDFKKGVSYGFNWKVRNFRGVGEEVGASILRRRQIEEGGGVYWTIPWFLGRRLRLTSHLNGYRRIEEPIGVEYIKSRYYLYLSMGIPLTRSIMKQLWVSTRLSFERRVSRQKQWPYDELRYFSQDFLLYGFSIYYDSRDNTISPWRGTLFSLNVDRYTSVQGLAQSYVFYFLGFNKYFDLSEKTTLIFAFDAIVHEGDVPEFFKMGLGGSGDLRGFVNGDLVGDVKFLHTLQLKRHVFGPWVFSIPKVGSFDITMNAVAFIDNGALMKSVEEIVDSQCYTTFGVGFELLSPLQDKLRFEIAGGEGGNLIFIVSASRRF